MRTCTIDGCDKPHRARGLCATHYNQVHQPDRHKPVEVECVVCGTRVVRHRASKGTRVYGQVCSASCRQYLTHGTWPHSDLPASHMALCLGKSSPWSPPVPRQRPSQKINPARFVACSCAECGSAYLVDSCRGGWRPSDLYCSMRCTRRVNKRRRRARERGRENRWRWTEFVGIWLRFDRSCAYCEQPIDGQPEPDHVVPLSRGGDDVLGNLLPACRSCNADKNDMTLDEWQADRARRGRPARRYSWMPTDTRFSHLVPQTVTGEAWRNRVA